ncbi:MAG: FlgD immunoglobulin-like domain containing protein [Candidatus Krumholzibacteriota bacterium]
MAVLGLYDQGSSDPDLQIFLDAFQVSFPILLDTQATYNLYRQTGATSPFPLDYVIDQGGRVAYFGTEYDPEAMTAVIDELLLNPAPVEDLPGAANNLRLEARPNPFNPRTEIHFELPATGRVSLDIHDARGRLVRRLITGQKHEKGAGLAVWDGNDDTGRALPSGLYLARIRAGGFSAISKLTLLR